MTQSIGYPTYRALLDCFVALVQETIGDRLISIVLYGSVARGEAAPESDMDLLLVVDRAPRVYRERLRPLLPILRRLRQQPCWKALEAQHLFPFPAIVMLSRAEADQNRYLYLDMIEDARILLDRDRFFEKRLEKLQHRLQELGVRKIRRNASWYWDLKPTLKPDEVLVL